MKTIPVAKVKELIRQLKLLELNAKTQGELLCDNGSNYYTGLLHAYFRSRKHAERLLQDNTTKRKTDKT